MSTWVTEMEMPHCIWHLSMVIVNSKNNTDSVARSLTNKTDFCKSKFIPLDNEKIAEFLIQNGAKVNQARHDGWSPLHWAAQRGEFQIEFDSN